MVRGRITLMVRMIIHATRLAVSNMTNPNCHAPWLGDGYVPISGVLLCRRRITSNACMARTITPHPVIGRLTESNRSITVTLANLEKV